MKILRLYHSGVVRSFRKRDRAMRDLGFDVTLAHARRWNEGGDLVQADASDEFAVPIDTVGSHPHAFLYEPWKLFRLVRSRDWDVLDVHEEPSSLAAAQMMLIRLLLRRRTPVLFYCAQNLEKRYPVPFRWIERWSFRTASAIYCCNEAAADILRSKGYRGRLAVIGLGIDREQFRPDERTAPQRPFRVGFVGRIESRKGVFVLLDAVTKTTGTELDYIGSGPDLDALQEAISARGLAERASIRGFVPHEDLPALYRSFDVLVVPSQWSPTWIEQFCRVAVEAMAAGVPVIAADIGSLPEVVREGGILVEPDDVEGYALAIQSLAEEPDRWGALRTKARQRSEVYDWPAIARAHTDLYEAVT